MQQYPGEDLKKSFIAISVTGNKLDIQKTKQIASDIFEGTGYLIKQDILIRLKSLVNDFDRTNNRNLIELKKYAKNLKEISEYEEVRKTKEIQLIENNSFSVLEDFIEKRNKMSTDGLLEEDYSSILKDLLKSSQYSAVTSNIRLKAINQLVSKLEQKSEILYFTESYEIFKENMQKFKIYHTTLKNMGVKVVPGTRMPMKYLGFFFGLLVSSLLVYLVDGYRKYRLKKNI